MNDDSSSVITERVYTLAPRMERDAMDIESEGLGYQVREKTKKRDPPSLREAP